MTSSHLKDGRLAAVRQALLAIGYDSRAIVPNYDFAVAGHQNVLARVELAAFSDPIRHDLHTSCITAQHFAPPDDVSAVLDRLSYLAPPIALILQADDVDIWTVTRTPSSQPLDRVPYNRLAQYFDEHARDFRPDALAAAKTKGHQLSFFDLDRTLLQFAYDTTQNILVDRFETAVGAARHSLGMSEERGSGDLTKAVLQILAAAILEDKQLLGNERSSTVEGLIQRSAMQYGQYFDVRSLKHIGLDAAQATFGALRQNVTFRSFTNEMLGYFYENAFVSDEVRRELGVYYTPRSIAKRILTRLPIEDIPPSDRVVFDGSSGSGNLLLAAFERMTDLLPSWWDRDQRHDYLVQRVHGVDVDQFATQVAGLSLFFIDLPAGDAWNVKTADFMDPEPTRLPRTPTILVGNPPFKEMRSWKGKRLQRASLFLEKYLDLLEPGGLLGVVLPETFLENSSCRDARRRLLDECDILELSHLPEGVFPMSHVATVIVLAKKLSAMGNSVDRPVRVEKVSALSHERDGFLKGERPRFSYVVPSTRPWVEEQDRVVSSSPLKRSVWDVIRAPRRLQDVALVRNGIIPGENQRGSHIDSDRRGPEWRPWLGGTRDLEPYALKSGNQQYVRYPGNIHRPRLDLESIFGSPNSKVLVNSGRAPGNPWRMYAAIDEVGYFPAQGIHCVIPKDGSVRLEELVAILNSSVANAWVDSRNRRRWLSMATLAGIPFPTFTESMRQVVIARVREIMALKQPQLVGSARYYTDVEVIRDLVLSVDDIVCNAFGVSDQGRDMLSKYFAGYPRHGLEWKDYIETTDGDSTTSNGRKWSVTGQVIHVDAGNDALTLWVRGYKDSQPFRIPIPEAMPGWALRPEAAFDADIPWQSRGSDDLPVTDLTNFRPIDFSYSRPEELVELLENSNKLDELYGR